MLAVHVFVQVKPDCVEDFIVATKANAENSRMEQGIARFDVIQDQADPTRFVLVEVYRTPEATIAHKETTHYTIWRDTVAPMMAIPRSSIRYNTISPDEDRW